MRIRRAIVAMVLNGCLASVAGASAGVLTPEMQDALERQKVVIAAWARHPLVIDTVKHQNERGPIAGMDEATWRALPADAEAVHALDSAPASVWLTEKVKANRGLLTEALLRGAKGEAIAFVDKPDAYGESSPRFAVVMQGKDWQGEPALDPAIEGHVVEIATPVLDAGKPIGVLVVGVALDRLAQPGR